MSALPLPPVPKFNKNSRSVGDQSLGVPVGEPQIQADTIFFVELLRLCIRHLKCTDGNWRFEFGTNKVQDLRKVRMVWYWHSHDYKYLKTIPDKDILGLTRRAFKKYFPHLYEMKEKNMMTWIP